MAPAQTKLTSTDGIYSAWITLSATETPVEVYNVSTSSDGKTVSGYIEAVDGQEFVIHHQGDRRTSLVAKPIGDGKSWGAGLCLEQDPLARSYSVTFDGLRDSPTSIRPFVFSPLKLTDDQDLASHNETFVKNVGTIKVVLHRTSFGQRFPQTPQADVIPEDELVHEKTKKAIISHTTGMGASRYKPPLRSEAVSVTYIDPPEAPFRTFVFHYLSRALLEIKGYAPSLDDPPAPPPAPVPQPDAATPAIKKERKPAPETSEKKRKPTVLTLSDSDSDSDVDDDDEGEGGGGGPSRKKIKRDPEPKVEVRTTTRVDKKGKKVLVIEDSD